MVFRFILWAAVALVALYLILCFFLFRLACRRFPENHNPFRRYNEDTKHLMDSYPDLAAEGAEFYRSATFQDVEITSFDGLRLHGRVIENPDARGVVVACHGYRSNSTRDFLGGCPFYYDSGFTLLLIDQRACGESQGKYVTFGVRESRDAVDWCQFAAEKYPGLPILLAGTSMGATTVLMASPSVPPQVKAIAADCGFVSPWEMLSAVVHSAGKFPAGPILAGVNLWANLLAGFDLRTSTKEALAKNTTPVLFAHGEADAVVPPEDVRENYNACKAPAVLLSVPNAGHGMSYCEDLEGYQTALKNLWDTYLFGGAEA
ncbi:MAG: alpha/beta hydrolase [Oscillospiraceae bacterium]|nr:alpha/beta hydrolase [Oscillospiraceae bacterium]